jgi:hypothetical protein
MAMNFSFLRAVLGLAALVAVAAPASAETTVNVTGRTLHVADLDPRAPSDVADIELGRAPPPGGSRQFTRREVLDLVRAAGGDPTHLSLPSSLRVTTASERWAPVEIAARADGAVHAQLTPGVTLVKLGAAQGVVVPPGTTVASVRLSIAKRIGRQELTVMAELRADDEVVARTPLKVILEVSEEALAPAIHKGDRLTLVVDQGNARVGANAIALADANTGDSILFKVTSTGKVLKARVASRDIGVVVDL